MDKMWKYIDKRPNGCWEWTGAKSTSRRGVKYGSYRSRRAHRVVFEALVGPIPMGLVLDHLCRNVTCVCPDHLEPVTHRENIMRGENHVAENPHKTHCPKGHPYSLENTRIRPTGFRQCKTCHREQTRRVSLRYVRRKRAGRRALDTKGGE